MSRTMLLVLVHCVFVSPLLASPDEFKQQRMEFVSALIDRGVYDYPSRCVSWEGTAWSKDSVRFKPVISPDCGGISIRDEWVVAMTGGEPQLVTGCNGSRRMPLSELIDEDDDAPGEGEIEVYLAGGGGRLRKSRRRETRTVDCSTMPRQPMAHSTTRPRLGSPISSKNGNVINLRGSIRPPHDSVVTLSGDLAARSKKSVFKVFRAHLGGFRYSLNKHLREHPSVLDTQLDLWLRIQPNGVIDSARVENSTTQVPELDGDILHKAEDMKFEPIPSGAVEIRWRLHLEKL